jgi:hypothetical protein
MVTMLLLTGFLFAVDAAWVFILGNRYVGVLQTGEQTRESREIDDRIRQLNQQMEAALEAKDTVQVTNLRNQIEYLKKKKETGNREPDY